MAIGSDPEIGVQFSRWGDMDDKSKQAWFRHMKNAWGTHLMGGYATVVEVPREQS